MTSFNFHDFLKALSPNIVAERGARLQYSNFGDTIQSLALTLEVNCIFKKKVAEEETRAERDEAVCSASHHKAAAGLALARAHSLRAPCSTPRWGRFLRMGRVRAAFRMSLTLL